MKTRNLIILSVLISVTIFSCKDEDNCTAGTGGQLTITAFPRHHGADTKPLWAYVKFNTQELPGTAASNYDLTIAGDTSENHIEIENVTCGEYYIYMIAFDPGLGDTVVGGIPYSTEETSGEVTVNVPVTE